MNFSRTEYSALYDLYTYTGGDEWTWQAIGGQPWNFSTYQDPCVEEWQGLNCTIDLAQNVTRIRQLLLPAYNLVGSLPESLGDFPLMQNLLLKNNSLTGTVPSSVGNLTSLLVLNMNRNKLSQRLPDTLSNLKRLEVFDFYINQLTGPVPACLESFSELRYLDLYENLLTGSVPAFMGSLVQLEFFYMGLNHLDGTLPGSLGSLNKVVNFYVNENHFGGPLPSQLSNLQGVEFMFVYDNLLTGSIVDVFDPAVQTKLSIVLFSKNQFTGPLPSTLFLLPSLRVIDAGSNCLVNSPLPESICSALSLQTIALDGMHTSSGCRKDITPFATTYLLTPALRGGIPDCVYSLPSLATLHLSSNGLTGTLPSIVQFGANFTDLGMSHNFISGTIPTSFQTRHWQNLDLSYNKLTGTLNSNFSVVSGGERLSLRDNRLSGWLPHNIIHADTDISVIEGNLFGCKQDESDLPPNDQYVEQYQCGSNSFNLSYYVWLSLAVFFLCAGMLFIVRRNKHKVSYGTTIGTLIPNARQAVNVFNIEIKHIDSGAVSQVSNPIRSERGDDRNAASASNRRGNDGNDDSGDGSCVEDDNDTTEKKLENFNLLKYRLPHFYRICSVCQLLLRTCVVLTSIIMVLLVPLYAILSSYFSTVTFQYAYQLSLTFTSGVEPLVLCMVCMMFTLVVVFLSFKYFFRDHIFDSMKFEDSIGYVERGNSTTSTDSSRSVVYLSRGKGGIYVSLIVIDIIVVVGANVGFVCMVLYGNQTTLSLAQFTLSVFKLGWGWVCSRATYVLARQLDKQHEDLKKGLLTTYCVITLFNNIVVPCLVVMAVSTTCFYNAFVPGERVQSSYAYDECDDFDQNGCASELHTITYSSFHPPFVYSYQCAGTILTYYAPSFIYLCIIQGILMPLVRWTIPTILTYLPEHTRLHRIVRFCVPFILKPVPVTQKAPPRDTGPYFNARTFLVMLINYLAVIMTFGVVFPPIAFSMTVTIISNVFFTRLEVKKFLKDAAHKGSVRYIEHLDKECVGVGTDVMLKRAMVILVTMSCWFYSLFLFDILGDTQQLKGAYWVLVLMIFLPLFLLGTFQLYTGTMFIRTRLWLRDVIRHRSTKANDVVHVHHDPESPLPTAAQHNVEVEMSAR